MAAVQRSIRIVCELLEAGMFGRVYGSFMINEVDIVFSKLTQVFLLTVKQLCSSESDHCCHVVWKVAVPCFVRLLCSQWEEGLQIRKI